MNLHDANSPLMEHLSYFHDWVMFLIIGITASTLIFLSTNIPIKSLTHRDLKEDQSTEFAWTLFPGAILIFIGIPSLRILYMLDEIGNPIITLKVVGHQWYWSYEYSDMMDFEFDSYMTKSNSLRLLDVDHSVVLPTQAPARGILSAADVLHSWTIPVLGVKADCVPGRLNQLMMFVERPGVFYGQCSEICGSNHSFMPIKMESISQKNFLNWVT